MTETILVGDRVVALENVYDIGSASERSITEGTTGTVREVITAYLDAPEIALPREEWVYKVEWDGIENPPDPLQMMLGFPSDMCNKDVGWNMYENELRLENSHV